MIHGTSTSASRESCFHTSDRTGVCSPPSAPLPVPNFIFPLFLSFFFVLSKRFTFEFPFYFFPLSRHFFFFFLPFVSPGEKLSHFSFYFFFSHSGLDRHYTKFKMSFFSFFFLPYFSFSPPFFSFTLGNFRISLPPPHHPTEHKLFYCWARDFSFIRFCFSFLSLNLRDLAIVLY